MKASLLAPIISLCLAAPILGVARDARACGGCYHKPSETETTVVTGHRMVLSVSPDQTVLWDQIQYDGDPSEFAWVLPVKPGARVELATDAWFETLDVATAVHVVGPQLDCALAPGASGAGCGASYAAGGVLIGAPGVPQGDVMVVHQGTVGPYETVTLSTDAPGALNTWLDSHGFAVDADIQPIIDTYVAEGFDFIALRLQPGQGVRAMKPVRVVMKGASPTLPLRMVAAGTGPFVGLSLFVITEGRFATKNFPGATISQSSLSWDHLTDKSNYPELRKDVLDGGEGRTWLTSYAKQSALLSPRKNPTGSFPGSVIYETGQGGVTSIAHAYMAQAAANDETGGAKCTGDFMTLSDSTLVVADTCPPDAEPPVECPLISNDKLDERKFRCGLADDLEVALRGLHPRDVWVTRLESFLPRAALSTDLELEPAETQSTVENWLSPGEVLHAAEACRKGLDSAAAPALLGGRDRGVKPPRGSAFALVAIALALLFSARRLQRSPLARAGS